MIQLYLINMIQIHKPSNSQGLTKTNIDLFEYPSMFIAPRLSYKELLVLSSATATTLISPRSSFNITEGILSHYSIKAVFPSCLTSLFRSILAG